MKCLWPILRVLKREFKSMEIFHFVSLILAFFLVFGLWLSLFWFDFEDVFDKNSFLLEESKKKLFSFYVEEENRFKNGNLSFFEWERVRKKFLDEYKKIVS